MAFVLVAARFERQMASLLWDAWVCFSLRVERGGGGGHALEEVFEVKT